MPASACITLESLALTGSHPDRNHQITACAPLIRKRSQVRILDRPLNATSSLPRLVGQARTLEIILGARLFDARTAERYGLINRALPATGLDEFVDRLARRIATLARGGRRRSYKVVDTALSSLDDGLRAEDEALFELFAGRAATELTHAVRAVGAQTRDGERNLEALLDSIVAEDA